MPKKISDFSTPLLIGFLLIVVVFLMNNKSSKNESCKIEGMQNTQNKCPACPTCPTCPACPTCPTCPEIQECVTTDGTNQKCPACPKTECPACPSCPVYTGNIETPTAREIADAIFPGRNTGILMSGEYFPIQDYIESCPSILSGSGTPVGAMDSQIVPVNEPQYYDNIREYNLHGYSSMELIDDNSNGSGLQSNSNLVRTRTNSFNQNSIKQTMNDISGNIPNLNTVSNSASSNVNASNVLNTPNTTMPNMKSSNTNPVNVANKNIPNINIPNINIPNMNTPNMNTPSTANRNAPNTPSTANRNSPNNAVNIANRNAANKNAASVSEGYTNYSYF